MSKSRKVYKYSQYFGRMGDLSGLFVASDRDIAKIMGKVIYFGEVLGKHSDISATMTEENIKMVSQNPEVIKFFVEELGGSTGTNPLEYYDPEQDDE